MDQAGQVGAAMAALFVSHSSADQAATERVSERLRAEGVGALFVDFDPELGIPAGRNWERELYAQVRKADAVVFLSSPASIASQWCFAEVALARLATASGEGTARVWDVATGAELHTFRHERAAIDVAFAPNGTHLATASTDGTARVWELKPDVILLAKARMRVDRQLTDDERRMAGLPS